MKLTKLPMKTKPDWQALAALVLNSQEHVFIKLPGASSEPLGRGQLNSAHAALHRHGLGIFKTDEVDVFRVGSNVRKHKRKVKDK